MRNFNSASTVFLKWLLRSVHHLIKEYGNLEEKSEDMIWSTIELLVKKIFWIMVFAYLRFLAIDLR